MAMKKMLVVLIAAFSLAAVGCKKKGAGGGAVCAQAINHSMELSKAEMQKMGTDDATMKKLVDLGIQRCTEDKWPDAAVKCMVDAKTMSDAQACYGKLSQEQQDKMNKAAMELATPAAGSGSGEGSASAGSGEGSAAAGSAAGSDTGSAAGSAAAGSDAAGSGSAAPN
jgi:hypothetical protein